MSPCQRPTKKLLVCTGSSNRRPAAPCRFGRTRDRTSQTQVTDADAGDKRVRIEGQDEKAEYANPSRCVLCVRDHSSARLDVGRRRLKGERKKRRKEHTGMNKTADRRQTNVLQSIHHGCFSAPPRTVPHVFFLAHPRTVPASASVPCARPPLIPSSVPL